MKLEPNYLNLLNNIMKKVLILLVLALGFNSYSQFSIHINNTYSVEGTWQKMGFDKYSLPYINDFSWGCNVEYASMHSGYFNSINFSTSIVRNSFSYYSFDGEKLGVMLMNRSEVYWRHYFGVRLPLDGLTTSVGIGVESGRLNSFEGGWFYDVQKPAPYVVLGLGYSYNLLHNLVVGGDYRVNLHEGNKKNPIGWRHSLTFKIGFRFNYDKEVKNFTHNMSDPRKMRRELRLKSKMESNNKFQKIEL